MTTLREAAQQALEALDAIREADMAGATPKMVMKARSMYEPTITALRAALAQEQTAPLTIERLRDALVASRIIPPAAVEDPDEYDDGVMLHRIEALHRRLK